jgi:hypothetical protein
MKGKLFVTLTLMVLVMGCSLGQNLNNKTSFTPKNQAAAPLSVEAARPTQIPAVADSLPENTATPQAEQNKTSQVPTQTTAAPLAQIGPEQYPADVNPLTGLPVKNPENLLLPPALVSITNFPISSRPQAGLSFAPFVFELYIGEGMTRYLALFYGDFPQSSPETEQGNSGALTDNAMVGPIRSGRLPYESIRKLFNGFLVMASGSSAVVPSLSQYSNVYGSDADNVNSALIDVNKLEKIAADNQKRLGEQQLQGNVFAEQSPENGVAGKRIWLMYSFANQINWQYDPASAAYHRFQDNADGLTFTQMTDRLTDEPLAFENVVILFAPHEVVSPTIIDVNLLYMKKMPALLFRDGQMFEVFWTTISEDYEKETGHMRPIRFVDAEGKPFPLKPGQTLVEVVQQFTPYREVPDSTVFYDLANKTEPGSGVWAVRFYPPEGAQ